jgi:hypothetical protein
VLYTQAYTPPMFGIVEKEGNKFKFQAGVNCYSTLEELPLEFVTAYKMWMIGTENDRRRLTSKAIGGVTEMQLCSITRFMSAWYATTHTTRTLVCSLHTVT